MIIEFSVANFLSFKDKVTFSMLANSSDGLNDNYIEVNNRKILKTSAIYGANASGKTNLFKILTIVISMLRNSNYINVNSKLPIVPFNFDKDMAKKSSEFEIRFIASGVRYVYGFIADTTNVYEEYLYYYPNGRETKIFDRTNINEYSFPQGDERRLKDIATKNTPNKFFIATATNWNYEKTEIPYRFLTEDIRTFNNLAALRDVSLREYLKDSKELKDFALEFLKKADFNIKDYKVLETDVPEDVLAAIPDFIKIGMNIPQKPKTFNAVFKHTGNDLELSYEEESMGTQIVFCFIPFIMDAHNNKKVVIVDELDKSLHPYLVEMIVGMFNDPDINKSGAQLIFNTHDTNLLKLNILRRDQIWFTEKDDSNGISDLYPLSDFSVRKTENVEKGYMLGRYGAVPFIKNDFYLWEE
ncbi:MAG: ATP-binding protein [Mycoplasma sp.]|nr:ATP-binding protein [Mycoplasma sp.]